MTDRAIKQYYSLPRDIQKETDKQLLFLANDIAHPSLDVKKSVGDTDNFYQGRIDHKYRFYFHIVSPNHVVVSIIKHTK